MVHTAELRYETAREGDMIDITEAVQQAVHESALKAGTVTVFVIGSTAAITTIEYEPGLHKDFPEALERIAPKDGQYEHEERWHDDNGHSHIRASLIGPSLTVPIVDGRLTLGTWQQIVLLELDTRPRQRQIVLQIVGD
jgi:secondary thiamine-phosphate synthase enzyme